MHWLQDNSSQLLANMNLKAADKNEQERRLQGLEYTQTANNMLIILKNKNNAVLHV